MIKPEVLEAMLAAGCSAEQIVAAVKADAQAELARAALASEDHAAEMARRRELGAARQRRLRERNALSRVTSVTNGDNPSPKESSPTPPKEITPSPEPSGSDVGVKRARANGLAEFKAECSDLDAERLDALVAHRRAKNGQLTGLAARLFRRDATACGLSIAEAVDTCISRNWITVKPEYFRDRQRSAPSATSPPRERTVSDVLGEIAAGTWTGPKRDTHEPDQPYIETSFQRRN